MLSFEGDNDQVAVHVTCATRACDCRCQVTIYDYLYQGPEFPNLDVLADDKFV